MMSQLSLNAIEQYLNQVSELLDKTKDPFAIKYRKELLSEIRIVASKNWIKDGEPILTSEQLNQAYINVQNKVADKSWSIVGKFNLPMN